MPIYDYDCMSCGRRIEVFHGIHAPGPAQCEVCGGILRKALSAPAIVFKGSGWAKLDARAKGEKPATGKAGEGTKGEGGHARTGGDGRKSDDGAGTASSETTTKPAPGSTIADSTS